MTTASHSDGDDGVQLQGELSDIAELPVAERAAAYAQLHQRLGRLLESTPVQLFDDGETPS